MSQMSETMTEQVPRKRYMSRSLVLKTSPGSLMLTKYFSELLVRDVYSKQGLSYSDTPSPAIEEQNFADELFPKLKRRIDHFHKLHGATYDEMITRIPLTEVNLGRQYKDGVNGILGIFDNHLTADVALALLAYFTVVLKSCLQRGLEDFTQSLVEWNYRVFQQHITEFESMGGWESVLGVTDGEGTTPENTCSDWYKYTKIGLVIGGAACLLKAVAR